VTRAGTWLALLAAAGAAGVCAAGLLFAFVLSPAERGDPPEGDGPVANGQPADAATPAKPPAPTGDATEAFRAFAREGEPFPPEWLVRTQRVYWAEGGALWADATMPGARAERLRTIEQICLKLSEYVTERLRLDWHGVSVRATSGQELLTRANPTDTCRPAE
jgi:hypothetical protein